MLVVDARVQAVIKQPGWAALPLRRGGRGKRPRRDVEYEVSMGGSRNEPVTDSRKLVRVRTLKTSKRVFLLVLARELRRLDQAVEALNHS